MNKYKMILGEREQYPALKNQAYFNSAGTGLIPKYVYDANEEYRRQRYYIGGDNTWGEDDADSLIMMAKSREYLARMIHCKAEDIAFGMNTSHIISFFTSNFLIKEGTNVIIPENIYNSNRYMLQIRENEGLEIRRASCANGCASPEEIESLIDENTVAVICDFVNNKTGMRLAAEAIGALCKKYNLYFILDCAQGCGVLPIDVQKLQVDLIATNNYKWMQGFSGIGFGYVSPRIRAELGVKSAGWMSDVYRFDLEPEHLTLRDDGGRFDLGYPNMPEIYNLGLVAKRVCELGVDTIYSYIMDLRAYLISKVADIKGVKVLYNSESVHHSQIVVLSLEYDAEIVQQKLEQYNVVCPVARNEDSGKTEIRLGLHYYNNEQDIDLFVRGLMEL